MSADRRIVLFGNGSHENLGCQAIDIGTACGLAECGVDKLTFMPARLPFDAEVVSRASGADVRVDTSLRDALQRTGGRIARRIARRLSPSARPGLIGRFLGLAVDGGSGAALALGGDNYTFDYGPPDVFFAVNRAFQASGIPLMMWGASIGPFADHPAYEEMAVHELHKARRIFVREDATLDYLSGLGLDETLFRMSDPAFLMPASKTEISGFESGFEGVIGVNFSPLIGTKLGLGPSEWRDQCAGMVRRLCAEVTQDIVLVAHVTVGESDDHALLRDVWEHLDPPSRTRTTVLPTGLDAQQIKWAIGQMHAFIGARTHATIAAMSQGVPTISVGYSAKAVGVNKDVLGHDRFVVGLDTLSAETLAEKVVVMLSERDEVNRRLKESLPQVQERSRRGFRQLVADIRDAQESAAHA